MSYEHSSSGGQDRRPPSSRKQAPDVIFLDVHEVLGGWVSATCELLGYNLPGVAQRWDHIERHDGQRPWNIFDVVGHSDGAWQKINEAGAEFWADVPLLSHAQQLYAVCSDIAPTYLLTSPSKHPSCADGVTQWIQRHFGADFRDYFIGSQKHAVSRPGALLIDDSTANCTAWRNPPKHRGGSAILFPGIGNELHTLRHDPLGAVLEQVRGLR